jgi:hypothetical protein
MMLVDIRLLVLLIGHLVPKEVILKKMVLQPMPLVEVWALCTALFSRQVIFYRIFKKDRVRLPHQVLLRLQVDKRKGKEEVQAMNMQQEECMHQVAAVEPLAGSS